MASSDNVFLPDEQCEICGARLSDEIVIQEFADGSIARLCAECAAGAALQPEGGVFRFPDEPSGTSEPDDPASFEELEAQAVSNGLSPQWTPAEELDAVEKTRELLTPVVDLITLQREMQGALQRLAASLETFATGVISENMDKTATVESRLEALEYELEQTRARLREAEALLAAGAAAAAAPRRDADVGAAGAFDVAAAAAAGAAVTGAAVHKDRPQAPPVAAAVGTAALWDFDSTAESTAETVFAETGEAEQPTEAGEPVEAAEPVEDVEPVEAAEPATAGDTGTPPYAAAAFVAQATPPPTTPPVAPPPVAPPAGPATVEHHNRPGFELAEVQLAQRYFNESQFTNRVRDVRRSLGKPKANLVKLVGAEPRALLTVTWDIIWYQYLIELRRDIASDQRVALHREGMDLDELTSIFKEKNASVDDEGRLDASELEVKLLSDPSTLITEMTVDEERALEDATEEIWDQRTAPEFKWDD